MSAIVEYNIQQNKFLTHENFTYFTNNSIFDFNYSVYFSSRHATCEKWKKYNKTKSMKLYNASIFVLIYSTCMCNENNGKLFK
jgi:hypothetical protein